MIPEHVSKCDFCGARPKRRMYRYAWWNGLAHVSKWFCPMCVRVGAAPPRKQLLDIGGSIRRYDA